jgi:hypothetical protein
MALRDLSSSRSHLVGLRPTNRRPHARSGLWHVSVIGLERFPNGIRQRIGGYVRRTRLRLRVWTYDLVGAPFVNKLTEVWSEPPWWRSWRNVLIRHVRESIADNLRMIWSSAMLRPFNRHAALRPNGKTTVIFREHGLTCERDSHDGLSTVQHVPRQRMGANACTVHAYMHTCTTTEELTKVVCVI